MRYIKFICDTPFCGTDLEEYVAFDDDYTDEQLDQYAADLAHENGEGYENIELDYSIYREDYDTEEEYEEAWFEAESEYFCECTGDWEEVSYEEFLENDGTYN